ncbi:hypothetical protein FD801_14645, partial [Klebsiella pneumoniae]|nr:hypothetical protein [Klebsiella pneumoniae]MBQ5228197.1 hypothetical protein [Klebsiella pneumoniae]
VVGRIRDLILQLSKSSIYSTKPIRNYTGKEKHYYWQVCQHGLSLFCQVVFSSHSSRLLSYVHSPNV